MNQVHIRLMSNYISNYIKKLINQQPTIDIQIYQTTPVTYRAQIIWSDKVIDIIELSSTGPRGLDDHYTFTLYQKVDHQYVAAGMTSTFADGSIYTAINNLLLLI